MGKHGPCHHCGVTSTPLWRNGPPEKPVLCNACGSRWRTKGSLTNYTPLHAREPIDSEELKEVTRVKSFSFKPKEQKLPKKKQTNSILVRQREMPYCDQNFRKIVEGDTSNRSSSCSAVSYSESCAHFGTTDASDMTGSAQSNAWDSLVPSKKRTCVTRPKPSSVEKLTKDLYSIMHEQQSSYLSGSSEEDLLYQEGTPMGSFEIGYGSVLIRHPNSKYIEEESEASSISGNYNKSYITNEAYSGSATNSNRKETSFSNAGAEKLKKPTTQVIQENGKRDKLIRENLQIMQDKGSPLTSIDLKDVGNFDSFMKYLTVEEQQQLLKYLPSTDTLKPPESLRSMFSASQFVETLSYFQNLLREGIFGLSFSGANAEECRTLKRLLLVNLTKSKWVECYKQLKDKNYKRTRGKEMVIHQNPEVSLKRPHDGQIHSYAESKDTIRSPKRICKSGGMNLPLKNSFQVNPSDAACEFIADNDGFIDNEEEACFSPRSIFASPTDRSSMLVPLQYMDDSSDHTLLLDVRCSTSFPEAELLYDPLKLKSVTNSSNGVAKGEGSLSNYQSSSSSSK
ncbi:GATA transcription factor 26 [Typha latifolia]|uniref:GATA transcription factor 26 n=1 Tax=Typha latifolia TaxID=4733 RepID=UPI003C2B0A20